MAKVYTKGSTVVDEVLSGAERYDIKDNGGTPIESNVQINLATSVAVAGTTINAARLNNIETGIDTLDTKVADANDLLTTGGTTTAYTLTTTGAAALATGERFRVKFNATAGATPTLNRDSKGAKSLKYYDNTGAKQACTSSNIVANLIADVVYDGTDYVVLDPAGVTGSGGSSDPIGNKRLSLESGVPISTTDQTAKTTIYWTDGTTNLSVAVPSTTNTPFDIFYSLSGGTLSTVNWTNDTTRATALAYSLGYLVKSGDIDKLYLGTGRTTGTSGQCEMKMSGGTSAAQKIFLWNYYNRVSFPILVTETTNTWAYTTAAWRQWNASANNQFEFVTGASQDCVNMTVWGHMYTTSGALVAYFNLGLDRSNAKDSQVNTLSTNDTANVTRLGAGVFNARVAVGYHYLALIEYGRANGVVIGDEGGTNIQSGAFGTFFC